jgi:hypothetical protein
MVESYCVLRQSNGIRRVIPTVPVRLSVPHITSMFAEADHIPVESYSTPAAVALPSESDVTTDPESGECRVHTSSNVDAAEALGLHPLRLRTGQHRVPDVLVMAEHRVVVPQGHAFDDRGVV